ncbi:hypothetical protein GCM10029976_090610 [Kribbella albertanoniae]|uniref:hypothetical protein n=1 Tax=Kribbella albertanoniae TaxID=1266829 RepID=UPI00192D5A25|nr:hypothetical protein [Kribbella albertanoniae]
MRRGELFRYHDASGVSGTGVVAHLVEFLDGSVALRWLGKHPSTAVWASLESVLAIHGHLGASEIRWLDPDPRDADAEMVTRDILPRDLEPGETKRPWPEQLSEAASTGP